MPEEIVNIEDAPKLSTKKVFVFESSHVLWAFSSLCVFFGVCITVVVTFFTIISDIRSETKQIPDIKNSIVGFDQKLKGIEDGIKELNNNYHELDKNISVKFAKMEPEDTSKKKTE